MCNFVTLAARRRLLPVNQFRTSSNQSGQRQLFTHVSASECKIELWAYKLIGETWLKKTVKFSFFVNLFRQSTNINF